MAERSVFNNIRLQGVGATGSVTIGREVLWTGKHSSTGTDKRAAAADVGRASWTVFGKYGNLTIFGQGGETLMRMDGFERRQREALAADLQRAGITLEDLEFCSSGANRGKYFFEDDQRLVVEQTGGKEGEERTRRLFDLDLSKVAQCVLPTTVTNRGGGSKEVSIQFTEERGAGADLHQLVELRLYVPPGSRAEAEGDDDDAGDAGEAARVQAKIQKIANLTAVTGSLLAEFPPDEGGFLLPRGRYAVEMYADFFRMHGNMYDYKIKYSDVERFILLPRTDDVHYAFILALERPIRQGQQRYQHLVWQLRKGEHTVTINGTEADLAERYGEKSGLKPELSGPLYQLVARVFKVFSAKKVFTTGKFRSADGRHAVSCSVKASTGQLYPLERSFAFIHKPTLVLRFEDVASVEFERFSGYGQGSATKNFDIRVQMKASGGEAGKEHSFTSIERNEYKGLLEFLTAKGLKIRNLQETAAREQRERKAALGMDSDSGGEDVYAQRLKNERAAESNEEDEDSPDEDFEAPGGGDDDDDDDSSGDDSGEDEDAPPKPEKKKAKKEKKAPKPEKAAAPKKKRKAEPEDKPKKKAKKKKDPNAPKGKQSSFILFGSSVRGKIKEEHPDFSLGDIGREIGKRWRELDEEGKKPFAEAAAKDAERYKTELAAYKAKLAAEGKDVGEEDE